MAEATLQRIREGGVVAIVTVDDAARIDDIADALVDGGVSAIEVTLRTSAAWDGIERLGTRSDLVVGAGTVLSPSDARRAAESGAAFVVSPGLDAAVVDETRVHGVLPLPGIATPTELQLALQLGLTALKLFPAEPLGGVAMLAALAGPFRDMRFMPSGGISPRNVESYLTQPNVFAVGCSWLVPGGPIVAGHLDDIRRRAHEVTALVTTARGLVPIPGRG